MLIVGAVFSCVSCCASSLASKVASVVGSENGMMLGICPDSFEEGVGMGNGFNTRRVYPFICRGMGESNWAGIGPAGGTSGSNVLA